MDRGSVFCASLGYDEEIKNVNFDVNLRHAEVVEKEDGKCRMTKQISGS